MDDVERLIEAGKTFAIATGFPESAVRVEVTRYVAHSRQLGSPTSDEILRLWLQRLLDADACVVCGRQIKKRSRICKYHKHHRYAAGEAQAENTMTRRETRDGGTT